MVYSRAKGLEVGLRKAQTVQVEMWFPDRKKRHQQKWEGKAVAPSRLWQFQTDPTISNCYFPVGWDWISGTWKQRLYWQITMREERNPCVVLAEAVTAFPVARSG
jgi:hypothetical protein